jgi:hypothetical protein
VWIPARQHGSPERAAQGHSRDRTGEVHTHARHPVEVRSMNVRVTHTAQGLASMLIAEQSDHIRLPRGLHSLLRHRTQHSHRL